MRTCTRWIQFARLIVSNILLWIKIRQKGERVERGEKGKEGDRTGKSLPTIRITKDGHNERQRRVEKRGWKGKKFNYKHRGARNGRRHTVLRERTRTMTRRWGQRRRRRLRLRRRRRRSRPNGHGLAPGKTLSAKRRESVQRLSLGFKKLLITWISSAVPPR